MANTKIRGKNFRLSLLDTTQKTIAMAQECTYSSEVSMLEANHKDNANYIEREPDTQDYSITGTSLLAWDPETTQLSFEFLFNARKNGTAVTWEFTTGTDFKLSGVGYIQTLEATANDGEWVADSWTIVANGPDSLDTIP